MAEQFDPYYTWLGIPPEEQPPNCYRLLGLRLFETNPQVIENAANRQMSHLRTFQVGPQSALSQKLLNEVAAAKICLLNPAKRTQYDQRLRAAMEEPDEQEDMPAVSSGSGATRASRKTKGRLIAVGMTVVLLAVLAAAIYGIYVSGSRPAPPDKTARVKPPPAKTPGAITPTVPAPKPPTPPPEPTPSQEHTPKEPVPKPPDKVAPEPGTPTEVPAPPRRVDLAELLQQNRWSRVKRPEPGELARLESDAATMAVNPNFAILAVAGTLTRPAPVRFIAAGTKSNAPQDNEDESAPADLAQRLGTLATSDRATCLAFGPSGHWLAVGTADGEIRLWDLRTGAEARRLVDGGPVRAVAFHNEERILAAIDAEGTTVRFWALAGQEPMRAVDVPGSTAGSLAFFRQGDATVVGLKNGDVFVFDAWDDSKRTSLATNRGPVGALAAVRGNTILAGTADGSVTVFAPKPRFVLGPFEPEQKPVLSVAAHEQSGLAALCGGDGSIRLWQFVEGRAWGELAGGDSPVLAVGFSQDGNTIFSLGADKTVRAWNTPTIPDNALAERVKPLDPNTPAPKVLLPVPNEEEQKALREKLLAAYALGESHTLPERQKLARAILEAARGTSGNPDEYFVLLFAAAEEARDSGSVVVLIEALDRLCGTFECDADHLSIDMLSRCAGNIYQREQADRLLSLVETHAAELLLDESRHEDAKRLSTSMYALCQKDIAKEFLNRARALRDKVNGVVGQKKMSLPRRQTIAEWRQERYRPALLKKYGGTVESERAVAQALQWLADVQFSDGGWSFDHGLHPNRNGKATNVGDRRTARNSATAMALLPFLAAGNTHRDGKYKKTVAAGLDFLGKQIKPEKYRRRPIGGSLWQGREAAWAHPAGSLVFAEAIAMTGDKRLKPFVEQLAAFSLAAQDPVGGGWNGYSVQREGEMHVTLAQVQSLFVSGLLTKDARVRATQFLNACEYDDGARYHPRKGDSSESVRSDVDGLYLRVLLGAKLDDPGLRMGIKRLDEIEEWRLNDVEICLTLSKLLFQSGGADWEKWNSVYRDKYVREQEKEGAERGSWYYEGGNFGRQGGRLFSTAVITLILETYYRYPRLHEDAK